ncbi:MAG TPA: PD-(D/E)XK nuclease family protein [Fimbriimonas sp.]
MPRKPTLSPSKITTYLACPVKFRWTYVDARGRWYLRSKSYYSFGSSLHRVLERFHDSNDAGVTTTDEALGALEESWIDAGFSSAEEMAEAYGEGREILERYVSVTKQRPTEAKTLFVERQLRYDLGDFVLIGRLDRLDEWPDGRLEVVDYKSGRQEVTEEEVADDIAMACYQLLVRRKFPDRPVCATIIALRTGASATVGLTDEQIDEFEADLRRLGNDILGEDYEELVPVFKPLCLRCDFLPLCRKHPEFAEL